MEKLLNKHFIAASVLLTSIYSGLIYNLHLIANTSALESYWLNNITNSLISEFIAITFISFTAVFLLSVKYVEKIAIKPLVTSIIILVGFCCYLTSTTWVLEWFFFTFFLVVIAIAYLTPCIVKLSSELKDTRAEDIINRLVFPLSAIIWVIISFVLFDFIETMIVWRILYIVTGSINIAASLTIYKD